MTLDPILNAPTEVQVHVLAVIAAVALGPFAIYRRRRDLVHRILGYLWVSAMAVVAGSGLFIESALWAMLGPFGPIHLLSLWVLYTLWRGVEAARRRDVATHRVTMRGLYWQSLGIAGLFTLLPGRRINRVVFPETPEAGGVVVVLGVLTIVTLAIIGRTRRGGTT
ncbi:DUF2306 domain-containing protein [Rhodophyticola sp.]|jgi:uncharacterized membrane protein|uniref:DUF2306 domain-containing protein n=1 Tax=Rhodophyticola sp. TaxID=2680032 RepID=UPI003D26A123